MAKASLDRARVKSFCDLLDFLHGKHSDWAEKPKRDKLAKLDREIAERFQIIDRRKFSFRAIEQSQAIEFGATEILVLEPPAKKAFLPVMRLSVDFQRCALRAEVALFAYHNEPELAKARGLAPQERLVALAFRFETPDEEGSNRITSVRSICCLPTARPALTVVSGDSGVSTI